MPNSIANYCSKLPKPLLGDWLLILASLVGIIFLFQTLWQSAPAATLRIRLGNSIYGEYSLQQHTILQIRGQKGEAKIEIANGKVRFLQAPCSNQYCVHQSWLKRAGQTVICLPNQLSLELLGAVKQFDSLNY